MEKQIESDGKVNHIEAKVSELNYVKEKFMSVIKSKIGDLLVEEVSRIIGDEKGRSNPSLILKLPHFLKSIFSFYNDEKLLIETSLLYIMFSLDLMSQEMKALYEKNISQIENKKGPLLEMKELLRVNRTIVPEFIVKFEVPTFILPHFSLLEKNFQNLVVYGLLKIFEWLNVLDSKENLGNSIYEQSFIDTFHSL